ncbi:RNA helicase [Tulasnella sp. JGI-2019a]|nr:RNA helicase [Tulasnella sp. JGI-2019a]
MLNRLLGSVQKCPSHLNALRLNAAPLPGSLSRSSLPISASQFGTSSKSSASSRAPKPLRSTPTRQRLTGLDQLRGKRPHSKPRASTGSQPRRSQGGSYAASFKPRGVPRTDTRSQKPKSNWRASTMDEKPRWREPRAGTSRFSRQERPERTQYGEDERSSPSRFGRPERAETGQSGDAERRPLRSSATEPEPPPPKKLPSQAAANERYLRRTKRPDPSTIPLTGTSRFRKVDRSTKPEPEVAPKRYPHQTDLRTKLKTELSHPEDFAQRPRVEPSFRAPPLLPGLLDSLKSLVGKYAKPTPIQALSIAHFLPKDADAADNSAAKGHPTLLASETGSGKSVAYLLPVLQGLKETEIHQAASDLTDTQQPPATADTEIVEGAVIAPRVTVGPRAIILTPTHELSRQISTFAKALSHNIKLRIRCTSNPNRVTKADPWNETGVNPRSGDGDRLLDILVGTPSKILSLSGGVELEDRTVIPGSQRTWDEAFKGKAIGKPESRISLDRVEWIIVDEADVLFDRDFIRTTEAILADVLAARNAAASIESQSSTRTLPFNLVLSSATIPVSLSNYLSERYPHAARLVSPRVHFLPKTLKKESVQLTDGNKMSAIYKKIEAVWADDALERARIADGTGSAKDVARTESGQGKILIFCNDKATASKLATYLKEERKTETLVMVGDGEGRLKGSNRHLAAFLNPTALKSSEDTAKASAPPAEADSPSPRILITTSLLARGLDFHPSVKHVFMVDAARTAVDFLHRAGRTGRAGQSGSVVLFERGNRRDRRAAGKAARVGASRPQRY